MNPRTVIIAGLPATPQRQLKAAVSREPSALRPGFALQWLSARNKRAGIAEAQVEQLLSLADRHSASSVLVVAQRPTSDSERVVARVRAHFRARLISASVLEQINPDPIRAVQALNIHLEIEERWCDVLMPRSESDALLLPETSFLAQSEYRDAWRAAVMAASVVQIGDVARYVENFEEAHRSAAATGVARHFVCASELRWVDAGARHGRAPFPMYWKYSFRIPEGFHYDVTSQRGRAFTIRDAAGADHRRGASEHANVDPHGSVR